MCVAGSRWRQGLSTSRIRPRECVCFCVRVRVCDVTQSYVWRDAFMCVTWPVMCTGSKKTVFVNFKDMSKKMHRTMEHVMSYFNAEWVCISSHIRICHVYVSRRTCECVMSGIWLPPEKKLHMYEHVISYFNATWLCVSSHIWIRHGYVSHRTYECVMSLRLVAHMNVSCQAYDCVQKKTFVHVWTRCILLLRRVGMRLVVCTNISCMHKNASTKIFEHVSRRCVVLPRRVSTRHDAIHVNVSCHARECVMSYI